MGNIVHGLVISCRKAARAKTHIRARSSALPAAAMRDALRHVARWQEPRSIGMANAADVAASVTGAT